MAVPAESAQAVTEKLAAAGIKAMLNFAPGRIGGKEVRLKNVDLSIELETLSFYLAQANGRAPVAEAPSAAVCAVALVTHDGCPMPCR